MTFNKHLAQSMYDADTEDDLRLKLNGERSDVTDNELRSITKCLEVLYNPERNLMYCEVGVYFGGTFCRVLEFIRTKLPTFNVSVPAYYGVGIDLYEDLALPANANQTHEVFNKWNILNVAYCDDLAKLLDINHKYHYTLIKGHSSDVLKANKPPFNVIFLDGNHTYAQSYRDFNAAWDCASTNAFIIFHNASNNIEPDPRYIIEDGGPYQVCCDIKGSSIRPVKFIEQVERCQVFQVIK